MDSEKQPGGPSLPLDTTGEHHRMCALAIEPESGGGSSATILSVDPDGTVWAATTVMEPSGSRMFSARGGALGLRLVVAIACSLSIAACGTTIVPAPSGPAATGELSPTVPPSPIAPSPSGSPIPTASESPPADSSAWVAAGTLHEARNATNLVVLGGGEVLIVGSDYETSWRSACGAATEGSDSVEIGQPAARTWETTSSLPSLREAPALVALRDGRALLTGGENGESKGNVAYSSTYVFDPRDATWTRSGLLNVARSDPAAVLLADGRVLVAGGRYNDAAQGQRILDSSELWDPASGAWSRSGSLREPRIGASAVTLDDGRVLVVGGVTRLEDVPNEVASAEIFDPVSGRWTSAGTLENARGGFVLVALDDGGALVAGGFDVAVGQGSPWLSAVERFDPASNGWSSVDDLPWPAAGASGVRLADGRVLVAGGSAREPQPLDPDGNTYITGLTADAALFDPKTGTWMATTPMPSPRAGASAGLLRDGSAVFAGGSSSEGEINATPGCPEADPRVVRFVPGF